MSKTEYRIKFSAVKPNGKRVVKRLVVKANDQYLAQDLAIAQLSKLMKYDTLSYPTFEFGGKRKLAANSISAEIARNATPDEE